jgi:hypothetical protein
MKSLCLIAALVAGVSFSLTAEEPVADLAAQKQALSKEIYLIREEFIKTDPTFAAEKAVIDEQRTALNKKAEQALMKTDPRIVELRTKLKAVNEEIKKAEKK